VTTSAQRTRNAARDLFVDRVRTLDSFQRDTKRVAENLVEIFVSSASSATTRTRRHLGSIRDSGGLVVALSAF